MAFVDDAMYRLAWLPLKVSSIIGALLGDGSKQQR
jgi:hypothetical protein